MSLSWLTTSPQAIAIATTFLLVGCGGGAEVERPETVQVGGVVTLDGTPVEKALVTFKPLDKNGKGASASTDADGRYSMGVFGPETGVLPGSYSVTVTKFEQSAGGTEIAPDSDSEDYDPLAANVPVADTEPKNLIPSQYASEETTPLTTKAELGSDVSDYNLVLTSS